MTTTATEVTNAGASTEAIQYHYNVGNEFYRLWLDPTMTYSGALYEPGDTLETAQLRRVGASTSIRLVPPEPSASSTLAAAGRTLLEAPRRDAWRRPGGRPFAESGPGGMGEKIAPPNVDLRIENWSDHLPRRLTTASSPSVRSSISPGSIRPMTNASPATASFFARCRDWLKPHGRISLQTFAYGSLRLREDAKRTAGTQFLATEIFPETDPPRLADIVAASQGLFEIEVLRNDRKHYAETCREWLRRLRAHRAEARRSSARRSLRSTSATCSCLPSVSNPAISRSSASRSAGSAARSLCPWNRSPSSGCRAAFRARTGPARSGICSRRRRPDYRDSARSMGCAQWYAPSPQPGKMYTRWGGFLDDVDRFDAAFFGISPREASSWIPAAIVLETAWEALEDAGLPPAGIGGSNTGVFIGISNYDYNRHALPRPGHHGRLQQHRERSSPSRPTACRICSGCADQAWPSTRPAPRRSWRCTWPVRACATASATSRIAGGVNLILSPEVTVDPVAGRPDEPRRPLQVLRCQREWIRAERRLRRGDSAAAFGCASRAAPDSRADPWLGDESGWIDERPDRAQRFGAAARHPPGPGELRTFRARPFLYRGARHGHAPGRHHRDGGPSLR